MLGEARPFAERKATLGGRTTSPHLAEKFRGKNLSADATEMIVNVGGLPSQ
jgi:hypothetical protein